ncbi:hypothetical protein [Pseudoalteromonas marina]|uniref:Uncharacterized protein n=1 Tax=Pseudoalteromonas marina TaxID=267375 RepID=A0ABT9FIE3_9GAMM|nr:hypothetical protein [Pseudoalteromonas marina]MDP2566375.1 hypothetical protein [Pseudoalteromonas marina]
MKNTVIGWAEPEKGENSRALATRLKSEVPELTIMFFRRGMEKPNIRILVFTSKKDTEHYEMLVNENSTDINAHETIFVTATNDTELSNKIQAKLREHSAYVAYESNSLSDNWCNDDIALLANTLIEEEPDFKTASYWYNRAQELCSEINKRKTANEFTEHASKASVFTDIYKQNKQSGLQSIIIEIRELVSIILKHYESEVELKSLSNDEAIDLALSLIK